MPPLLSCESISKSYGLHKLFSDISFGMFEGERLGMIGPNGSGKSTFIKILAGLETPDSGEVSLRRQLRLGYVPQEEEFPEGSTVEEVLLAALQNESLDAHERQVRVDVIIGRLGFPRSDQRTDTLSGGWRKRLAIARALVTEPELLLLDEPTNHLDLEGILWLEKLLKNAPFAFLLISHDRYMLENVTNRIVELSRAYPDGYFSINGAYSDFLEKREDFLQGQISQQQALTSRVRLEIDWLKRGARARTTKAKGRIEAAGRLMEELEETKIRNDQRRTVEIGFDATGRKTRKLLVAKDIAITLGGRTLFSHLNLNLLGKMKLGLLGPNGSGKTTLLRLLNGELEPDAGEIWRAEGLRVVRFQQDRADLDRSVTLREALSPNADTVIYQGKPYHVTAWAKKFLFQPEQLIMQVSELSGGEQSRILIARMMLEAADVLILDEPTNDLDIPSLDVLEESLADFPGTLVLVTHDRYLMDRLSSELLALDGKGGHALYTEYAQWERVQEEEKPSTPAEKSPPRTSSKPTSTPRIKLTWKEERELEAMEETLLAAESEVEAALLALQDSSVFNDHRKLHDASERHHHAEEELKRLYARWEALEAKRLLAENPIL